MNVTRLLLPALGLAAVFVTTPARAQDDCAVKWAELKIASNALRDCRKSGMSCDDAVARRDAAEAATAGCPEEVAAPASAQGAPGAPAATHTGKIAVYVQAAKPETLDAAAREGLGDAVVLETGAVRSARAFLGLPEELDDAGAEKLRVAVSADRLIVVQVKTDGSKRFVAVKAVDEGGAVTPRFGETTDAELPAVVEKLVAALPAVAAAAAPVPAVSTAVAPVAVATAAPTPKPWATPLQAPQYRARSDREDDETAYAKMGTRVFSGDIDFAHVTGVSEPEGGGDTFTTRTSEVSLRPQFGYFVSDGLLLGVAPILTTTSSNDDERETDTTTGAVFVGAFLSDTGSFYIGPQLTLGYASRTYKISQGGFSADFTQTGPILGAGLAVRAPVGRGGVIGFAVYAEHRPTSITGDLEGGYTFTTIGVSNSIGVFF